MRRFAVVAVAPLLLAVAAGCGSSSSSSTKSSSTPAAAPTTTAAATPASGPHTIAVGETEYKLTPATPSAKSGTVTIVARNNGKITHAIEVEGGGPGGKDAKSSTIAPGQTTTLKVDLKPGKTYEWYCPIDGHKGLGMKGTITVSGASASASATPKATSSSSSNNTSSGSSGNTSSGSSGGSSGGSGYGY
jgi:plastocyanin